MDLTDLTVAPMIPLGIGIVSGGIRKYTGWHWLPSFAAGLIPGAILGLLAGSLLFLVASWILPKLLRRQPQKPPD
jgi:hypothetical protein